MKLKHVILFGLSGSGKDTISNYLKNNYDYFPIRIAGTIKQIIMEKYKLSFNELEEQKRTKPYLREEHHHYGDLTFSENRLKLILEDKLFEINNYKQDYQQIVICDGRRFEEELKVILEYDNWNIILLSRQSNEYKRESHSTEQFNIKKYLTYIEEKNMLDRVIVIYNNENKFDVDEETNSLAKKCLGYFNISGESDVNKLYSVIDYLIENEMI